MQEWKCCTGIRDTAKEISDKTIFTFHIIDNILRIMYIRCEDCKHYLFCIEFYFYNRLIWYINAKNGSLFHQTFLFVFQLSEMTADLGEEHSAATLATERLEVEQAERMKLQKDNSELQVILCSWLEYIEMNKMQ